MEKIGEDIRDDQIYLPSVQPPEVIANSIARLVDKGCNQDHLLRALQRMALHCPAVDLTNIKDRFNCENKPNFVDILRKKYKNTVHELSDQLINQIERTVKNVNRDISPQGQALMETYMKANPPVYHSDTMQQLNRWQIRQANAKLKLASVFDRQGKAELASTLPALDI